MLYNSSQTISAGNAVFIWWKSDVAQALNDESAGGVQVCIGNSTTAFKCFYVAGADTYQIGGWRCSVIDPTQTSSIDVGSPTSATDYFGVRWSIAVSGPSKGFPYKIDAIRRGRTATITAGDSGDPATWPKLATYSGDTTRRWGLATPTDTGAQVQGIVYWGGGAAVYSRDANRSIVFLNTKGFTTTSFTQVVIQHASTDLEWDNISFTALGTLNRGLISILNNAKAWLTNCTFTGLNTVTSGGTNTKFDGSKFRSCDLVTIAGGSFIGCQFLTPTVAADEGAIFDDRTTTEATELTNLEGCTFSKGTNSHHAVRFGTGVAHNLVLKNCAFNGFSSTADATNATFRFDATSGTIDLSLQGCTVDGVAASTSNIGIDDAAGITVTVIIDPVTVTVNVKDASGPPGQNIQNARVLLETSETVSGGEIFEASTTSLTQASGTATCDTTAAHGLETDDWVVIRGAQPDGYNKVAQVTVTDTDTFTYSVNSSLSSPATGTPVVSYVAIHGLTAGNGNALVTRTFGASQGFKGWARKMNTSAPFYKQAAILVTVDKDVGNSINVVLQDDS